MFSSCSGECPLPEAAAAFASAFLLLALTGGGSAAASAISRAGLSAALPALDIFCFLLFLVRDTVAETDVYFISVSAFVSVSVSVSGRELLTIVRELRRAADNCPRAPEPCCVSFSAAGGILRVPNTSFSRQNRY